MNEYINQILIDTYHPMIYWYYTLLLFYKANMNIELVPNQDIFE